MPYTANELAEVAYDGGGDMNDHESADRTALERQLQEKYIKDADVKDLDHPLFQNGFVNDFIRNYAQGPADAGLTLYAAAQDSAFEQAQINVAAMTWEAVLEELHYDA